MSDEPKLCPVCGWGAVRNSELSYRPTASCDNPKCWLYGLGFHLEDWDAPRPIEDGLRAEIAAKDAEIERLKAGYEIVYTYLNDVLEEIDDER